MPIITKTYKSTDLLKANFTGKYGDLKEGQCSQGMEALTFDFERGLKFCSQSFPEDQDIILQLVRAFMLKIITTQLSTDNTLSNIIREKGTKKINLASSHFDILCRTYNQDVQALPEKIFSNAVLNLNDGLGIGPYMPQAFARDANLYYHQGKWICATRGILHVNNPNTFQEISQLALTYSYSTTLALPQTTPYNDFSLPDYQTTGFEPGELTISGDPAIMGIFDTHIGAKSVTTYVGSTKDLLTEHLENFIFGQKRMEKKPSNPLIAKHKKAKAKKAAALKLLTLILGSSVEFYPVDIAALNGDAQLRTLLYSSQLAINPKLFQALTTLNRTQPVIVASNQQYPPPPPYTPFQ